MELPSQGDRKIPELGYPEVPTFPNIISHFCTILGSDSENPKAATFVNQFLLCYSKYATPLILFSYLEKLSRRYDKSLGSLCLLRLWVSIFFHRDIWKHRKRDRLPRKILKFLSTLSRNPKLIFEVNRVKLALIRCFSRPVIATLSLQEMQLAKSSKVNIFSFMAKDVAEQLTLLDSIIFSKIPIEEFTNIKNSSLIRSIVNRSDKLTYWAASNILNQHDLQHQIKAIKYFITIAQFCDEMGDYNAVEAIKNTFHIGFMSRLLSIWNLPLPWRILIARFNSTLSPANNYSNLRHTLKKNLEKGKYTIPYLGLFLRDLTFIDDGNENILEGGQLNVSKLELTTGILSTIRSFQQFDYSNLIKTKKLPLLRQLYTLHHWPLEKLEETSNTLKPRRKIDDDTSFSSSISANNISDAEMLSNESVFRVEGALNARK